MTLKAEASSAVLRIQEHGMPSQSLRLIIVDDSLWYE